MSDKTVFNLVSGLFCDENKAARHQSGFTEKQCTGAKYQTAYISLKKKSWHVKYYYFFLIYKNLNLFGAALRTGSCG